jgi:hypothetical protein
MHLRPPRDDGSLVASLDRPGAFTSLDFALDRLVDKGGPFLTLGKDGGNPLERPRREFRPDPLRPSLPAHRRSP